jgi:Helix-turn-helix domain
MPKANYHEPAIPSGATSFKNCSVEVSKLPLDVFLRVGDGRKFLLKCRQRKALLQVLASFASHDGTSCYPSNQTLQERACLSGYSITKYLRDLESDELRFVVKGGYAWEDGPRARRLVMPTVEEQDTGIQSRMLGLEEQDAGIQKQDEGVRPSSTRQSLDPPVINPPAYQPEADGQGLDEAIRWVREKFREATGKVLSTRDAEKLFSNRLSEAVKGTVEQWLENRPLAGLNNPAYFLLREFEDYHDPANRPEHEYSKEEIAAIRAHIAAQREAERSQMKSESEERRERESAALANMNTWL